MVDRVWQESDRDERTGKIGLIGHMRLIKTEREIMSEHTPGPWQIVNFQGENYVAGKDGVSLWDDKGTLYKVEDGKLIAAAPEMLELLKESYGEVCNNCIALCDKEFGAGCGDCKTRILRKNILSIIKKVERK